MNFSEEILHRLKKVYMLATRGEAGEAETAREMLNEMLSKNGLTIEDLVKLMDEAPKRTLRIFRYANKHEHDLLISVICQILDAWQFTSTRIPKKRKVISVYLTDYEFQEVERIYSIYKRALQKHLNESARAFRMANKIGPKTAPLKKDEKEPTREEIEEWLRIQAMATKTERTPIFKALN